MAGKSRFRTRKPLYKREDLVLDLARTMNSSREESSVIITYIEILMENALCRCESVETVFGVVKAMQDLRTPRVRIGIAPNKKLEERLRVEREMLD
jgi:hypothetical protein